MAGSSLACGGGDGVLICGAGRVADVSHLARCLPATIDDGAELLGFPCATETFCMHDAGLLDGSTLISPNPAKRKLACQRTSWDYPLTPYALGLSSLDDELDVELARGRRVVR